MYGPYPTNGNSTSANFERGFYDYSTHTLYWLYSVTKLSGSYGPSGLSSYYEVVINALGPTLTITTISATLPGDLGGVPNAWLLTDGSGGFYLGGGSGYGNYRWYHIAGNGNLLSYVGTQGPLSCGAGPTYSPPADAKTTPGGYLVHVDGNGTLATIGPGAASQNIYPVVPGTGTFCDGTGGHDCQCFPQLAYSSIGTLGSGAINGASIAAVSATQVWILTVSATQVLLTEVNPSTGVTAQYVLSGGVGVSFVCHLEYYSADNTLLYWAGDDGVLYKWSIANKTVINTANLAFTGSGPIVGGKIPNGIDIYDAVTLVETASGDGNNPGLPAYNDNPNFGHIYDGGTVIWLQANDNNVYGAILGNLPLSLECASGTAQLNVPYGSYLTANGGSPPYTFAIISGSLPPLLALNPSTGAITGIPTQPGTYPYTAQVTDSLGITANNTCAIIVPVTVLTLAPMPTLEITRDMDADWDDESTFFITQSDPFPFTLRGIVLRLSYNPD